MIDFACPKCELKLLKNTEFFICKNCNGKFHKKNNIPILLIDKMEPLDSEDIIKSNQSCKRPEE